MQSAPRAFISPVLKLAFEECFRKDLGLMDSLGE